MLESELFISFNPFSHNQFYNVCTTSNMKTIIIEHKPIPITQPLFKIKIVKLFELAFSTIFINTLSIPNSSKQGSINFSILSPYDYRSGKSFIIIL